MKPSNLFKVVVIFGLALAQFLPGLVRVGTRASTNATTWYVNAVTGADSNSCLSAGSACRTINGAINKSVGGDTIQVAAGTYPEYLDINWNLTINGAGPGSTFLDGSNTSRVVTAASSQINLTNLTVQNGYQANQNGAGIYNFGGLLLDNVHVAHNHAGGGGAGIFAGGDIVIQDSQIYSNTAEGVGGAIYVWSNGAITVTNSLVADNTANQGGGIYTFGQASISDSNIQGNHAAIFGGGVAVFGGSTSISRVTLSGNTADSYTAGVVNNLGSLNMTNVTISDNSAPNYTGVANISALATTTILNSTIARNHITNTGTRYGGIVNLDNGVISLQNTIVALNDGRNCLAGAGWNSLGNNLSSDSYCAFTAAGDLQTTDPLLAPLGDYGGAMATLALQPGSQAIDGGNNTGCAATDERGVPRPFDGDHNATATCDIGAFEARNQLSINDVTLVEGDAGSTNAVFTVSLAPASDTTITVDYATSNGSATSGSDYQATSGTLTFNPGATSQTIQVPVTGDTSDELDETFSMSLSNPNGGDLLDPAGTGTIQDDDGAPALTINDVSLNEGNTGTIQAVFTVSLSPAHNQTVTVNYATAAGTAVAGNDFVALNGTLTFSPGQTSKTVSVTVNGDVVDEGASEAFQVNLSSPTNAAIGDGSGTATINDDDTATISVEASQSVSEGNSGTRQITFSVTISTPSAFTVSVDYASQSGVGGDFATPGVDYIETSGTLTFNPGEVLKTFTVTVMSDLLPEQDEHFSVVLANATPISIYGSTSLGMILNDDAAGLYLPLLQN